MKHGIINDKDFMLHVVHRVNSVKNLLKIPNNMGIEIDIRDHEKKLNELTRPFKKRNNIRGLFEKFFSQIYNCKCKM